MIRAFLGFLGAEPEEDVQVLLLLGMGFFMGIFIACYEVGAEVLFLKTPGLGDQYLDYAFFSSGGFGIIATALFVYFQRKVSFEKLAIGNMIFISLYLIGISVLFSITEAEGQNHPYFKYIVFSTFVSLGPIAAIMLLNFWGTFNRMFNLRAAKRIIGGVDTGQLTATIIAFFAIALIPKEVYTTSDLILISAICITCTLLFLIVICVKYDLDNSVFKYRKSNWDESKYSYLYKNKFLRLLSLFLIISMVATQFMDFTFLSTINVFYPDEQELKTFIAFFSALVMIVSFLIQTFLNDWIIGTYGLRVALLIMPAILGLFIFGAIVSGSIFGYDTKNETLIYFFLFVSLGKLFSAALKDALENPAFKLFFLPLDIKIRLDIQTKIEGVVNEFSSLLAGSMLIGLGAMSYFKLIHYSIFIIVLVGVMFWLTGKLYLSYRFTLQKTLSRHKENRVNKVVTETDIIKLLRTELEDDEPEKVVYILKLMERVEPFLMESSLVQVIGGQSDQIKPYVLNKLEAVSNPVHIDLLKEVAAGNRSSELKELALKAVSRLSELTKEQLGTDEIKKLVRSTAAADRVFAAHLLAHASREEHVLFLVELLRDINTQVRKAAIIAAGRNGSPDCWPYLIRNLNSPIYSNAASAALTAIGGEVLLSLETAFNRTGADLETQVRIVQIYGRIGGEEAESLLWKKIDVKDQKVFSQVLLSLSQMGYRAEDFQAARIKINIEQDIEDIVWNMAALEQIPEDAEHDDIRQALEEENKHNFEHVYMLLSMTYDPESIALVKENVESGISENITFAIELLDVFLTEDLKPKLYPILDDITLQERIRKLDEYFPPEIFESLEDVYLKIINRDYNHINKWTKALALYKIGKMPDSSLSMDLVANLFNPDPMLRQTAGWAMFQISKSMYEHHASRIDKDVKREIDRVILPPLYADDHYHQDMLYVERTKLLKKIDAFEEIPGLVLSELSINIQERKMPQGSTLVKEGQAGNTPMYIIVEGTARAFINGEYKGEVHNMELIGETHVLESDLNTVTIELAEDTVVFLLDKDKFYELLSKNHEMIAGLIQIMNKKFENNKGQLASATQEDVLA